jgi:hypothetical protein
MLSLCSFSLLAAASDNPPKLNDTSLFRGMGGTCKRMDLGSWSHPVKQLLAKRKGAKLEWAESCQSGAYAIFAVRFKYDPRGLTKDYFIPLYADVIKANGQHPTSLISLADNLIINLSSVGENRVSEKYEVFSQ